MNLCAFYKVIIYYYLIVVSLSPVAAMEVEQKEKCSKRKRQEEPEQQKVSQKKSKHSNHAKIFLQDTDVAEGHPTNGGIEMCDRIEALSKHFLKVQSSSVISPKIREKDIKDIKKLINGHKESKILTFLADENKESAERKALVKNHDLILDEEHSIDVALNASSQHLLALKKLMLKGSKVTRILSIARPPGHHACHEKGEGFCLINHVGVLLASHYLHEKNVLVLDFDIHQGDGTERFLNAHEQLFAKLVQFVSVHVESSGKRNRFFPGDYYRPDETCASFIHNFAVDAADKFDRLTITNGVVEKIKTIKKKHAIWKPDVIIFSAGFDGHKKDRFGGGFSSKDYGIFIEEVMREIGNIFVLNIQKVPVLAILEGGYNIEALKESANEFYCALAKSG